MALKKLKVRSSVGIVSDTARLHNALVELIGTMEGRGGAKVTVSEKKIIIEAGGGTGSGSLLVLTSGTKSITLDAAVGITMADSATGKSLTLAFSALAQNLALRIDDYCDGTTAKKQTHIASAPHT